VTVTSTPATAANTSSEPNGLVGCVEQGLALRAGSTGQVDPAEVQRLLKQLRRLEPAALQALAEAAEHPESQDFAACLRSLA